MSFARVLGERPRLTPAIAEFSESVQEVLCVLGPPERSGGLFFWNFQFGDKRCSLYAHSLDDMQLHATAPDGIAALFDHFLLDTLLDERAPLFAPMDLCSIQVSYES